MIYLIFDVFNNILTQSIFAILTSLLILILFGKKVIEKLQKAQIGQVIRKDGPESHYQKKGTPTMGGVLIIFSILISILLWCDLTNPIVWILIFVLSSFGFVGFYDDYLKLIRKNPQGLKAKYKYSLLSLSALIAVLFIFLIYKDTELKLYIPYTGGFSIYLGGFLFCLLGYFVIVGSSNAVNLTDGLDGLVIFPVVLVSSGLAVFSYICAYPELSSMFHLTYIPYSKDVFIVCSAIVGAGIGFLWFNSYPAELFMGDVGALALGATLGTIAIILRQEIILFIMGFLFVIETLSVILQVGYYKLTKKRIFRMAPIHHHFELKGWPEPKVVIRLWIITVFSVLIGLLSLML